MKKILDNYLEKMEKYLRPVPVSERIDIINEIKSEMQELQNNGVSDEMIMERLGNPKDLAKAYLGDLITKEKGFSWNRVLIICAFFSLVGFSGMVVIPCLGVIAPTFIVCGAICPCLGLIKLIDQIFHLGLPFAHNIGIFVSESFTLNPLVEFILILLTGVLLFLAGIAAWKLLVFYCKKVSGTAKRLFV